MKYFSLIIGISILFSSCQEDDPQTFVPNVDHLEKGMVVLCEGLFQHNNASVNWVQLPGGAHDLNFFETKTGRSLGDTGNDMIRYGGKIYIVVNVSSTVEVMSAVDFSPVGQIEMMANGQPKQPRFMAASNGKVYITCYDGFVDVLDTTTLTIDARIGVGENPEGIAVSNNKLYVANSGGLNFPDVDSTVSVIDIATNTELQKITVGINPGAVMANDAGEVFVISRGDYGGVPSRLRKIDATTDQVVNAAYSFDISGMSEMSSTDMIVYDANGVHQFNYQSDAVVATIPLNMATIHTLYGIQYHETEDVFYVLDAMGYTNQGVIRKYDPSGTYLSGYSVGLNPTKLLFFD
ncbi:MAG: YncE family protein [bacterium]|nr:YncE family protein [bacterium]